MNGLTPEILVWVHVPEFELGCMSWGDALNLARERDSAAAEMLQQDALKLENVERAARICAEALDEVPDPAPARLRTVVERAEEILAELGY